MVTREQLIKENQHLKIAGIIIIACLLIIAIGLTFKLNNQNKNICYDYKSINETLKQVEKNCRSTFITTKYGQEGWFVFESNVCNGVTCDSKYYKLEDCIAEHQ